MAFEQQNKTSHFGFREVSEGEKTSLVKDVFRSVADRYDLMNDRQQDIFIAGIFVDPMQAEGIDNYIEFGYDNCECPDVMDELYETCPALMSKVDKFKDRKDAQTRVTIEFLDRMMDMVIQESLSKPDRFKPVLISESSKKVQEYEQKVIDEMRKAGWMRLRAQTR